VGRQAWAEENVQAPSDQAWWPAVGLPVERRVRRSPNKATEHRMPQVVQNVSLPWDKRRRWRPRAKVEVLHLAKVRDAGSRSGKAIDAAAAR
jgi:hypothetical protein